MALSLNKRFLDASERLRSLPSSTFRPLLFSLMTLGSACEISVEGDLDSFGTGGATGESDTKNNSDTSFNTTFAQDSGESTVSIDTSGSSSESTTGVVDGSTTMPGETSTSSDETGSTSNAESSSGGDVCFDDGIEGNFDFFSAHQILDGASMLEINCIDPEIHYAGSFDGSDGEIKVFQYMVSDCGNRPHPGDQEVFQAQVNAELSAEAASVVEDTRLCVYVECISAPTQDLVSADRCSAGVEHSVGDALGCCVDGVDGQQEIEAAPLVKCPYYAWSIADVYITLATDPVLPRKEPVCYETDFTLHKSEVDLW